MNPCLFSLACFLIGLLFGSFLNVCISRLPRRESVVGGRSRCPACGATIRWYNNIPLVSWVLLGRRCRDCKAAIPWRYPLVELAVAAWFALVASGSVQAALEGAHAPLSAETWASIVVGGLGAAILGFLLIGLMVMDWETMLLPDAFTLTGILIGMVLTFVRAAFLGPHEDQVLLTRGHVQLTSPGGVTDHGNLFFTGPEAMVMGRVAAICGAAFLLLAIRWGYRAVRKREGMGLGDVKLLAMIAAFLGFWPAIVAFFIGVLAATVYALLLLVRGKANTTTKLAFGSFLCVGGLLAAQFANRLIGLYIAILR